MRKYLYCVTAAAMWLICSSGIAYPAKVILKSGKQIEGDILERTADYIKIDFNGVPVYYQLKYIKEIIEDNKTALPAAEAPFAGATTAYKSIPVVPAQPVSVRSDAGADLFLAGLGLAAEGKFPEAAEVFRQKIKASPQDFNSREALKMVEDVIAGNVPVDYAVFVFKGTKYMAESKYAAALEVFKEAVKLNSQDATLYYYLGVSSYFTGESEQSISYLMKAAELNPKDPEIFYNLGIDHFSLGDYKSAIIYLEKAVVLAPEDPEIRSLLGTAEYLSGDFVNARDNLIRSRSVFEKSGESSKAAEITVFLAKIPES